MNSRITIITSTILPKNGKLNNCVNTLKAPKSVKIDLAAIISGAETTFKDGYHQLRYGDFNPTVTTQKYPRDSYYNKGAIFDGINIVKQTLGMATGETNKIVEEVNGVVSQKSTEDSTGNIEKFQTYAVIPSEANGD